MPRGDGRRRLQEVRRVLQKVRSEGLAPRLQPVETAALIMFICEIVGNAPVRGTSARVTQALAAVQDRANAASAVHQPDIACRKGCSHCCKTFVSASPVQVFAIADYVRSHGSEAGLDLSRLATAEAVTRGVALDDRDGAGLICPFLFDDACAIYPIRPPACRAHMSVDVSKCIAASLQKAGPDIPMPYYVHQYRTAVDQALWAVLHKRGLDHRGVELGEAVMTVLPDVTAEERWYRGQDVFAGVARDPAGMRPMPPDVAEKIWDSLWAIAHGEVPAADAPLNHLLPAWCFR